MKAWKVWCPEAGEDEPDAQDVEARSAWEAATQRAREDMEDASLTEDTPSRYLVRDGDEVRTFDAEVIPASLGVTEREPERGRG